VLVYLLRHAKSSWKEHGLADHDRPLAPRGRRAAKAIGRYLREHDFEPELVLCSTAARARETLERVDPGGEHHFEADLYAADAATLLARLQKVRAQSVMLIGHNPGIQDLAIGLARDARELEEKFPTGALAMIKFDKTPDWQTGELANFIRPRDLD
jgi:phosphohistidine phosphatase